MPSSIQTKIEKLREQIRHHDHLYYILDKPDIADKAYDALFQELMDLESKHPEFISPDSPTQRVAGRALEFMPKFTHRVPLLSLDSFTRLEDVVAFDKRIRKETEREDLTYVVEPKLDGLSVELVYQDGLFVQAGTRGDGIVGEEVTQNARTIKSLPLKLSGSKVPMELHLRGEILLPLKGFEKLNKGLIESGKEPFANPRNAASGSVRQLNPRITASRPLDLYVYGMLYATDWAPATHWETLETLKKWGLRVNDYRKRCRTPDEIYEFHQEVCNNRDNLDYEVDGIVVKLDEVRLQDLMGYRSRSPRWALAFKFESRKEVTIIDDIVVQVGRQGTLTPVAILKPVDVGGVTVSRATLHNLDIVRKLDVRVGDEVKVARAGDVIPEVVEVHHDKRKGIPKEFEMPSRCPVCKSPVEREGAYFLCMGGYTCPAQLKWAIVHYASRRAMNIEGLGQETVDCLVDQGLIKNVADLYTLTKEELLTLEGFKDKKAQNLLDGIEGSKKRPLSTFVFALGIPHVGEEVARVLVRDLGSLEKLQEVTEEDVQNIKGIGPQIAASVQHYFHNPVNRKLIQKLLERGVKPLAEPKKVANGLLQGKTFVFTGEMEVMSRPEAEKKVESLGAKASGSVSKKTDYVVAGPNAGSKLDKAQQLGLKILDEKEFLEMLAGF